MAEYSGLPSTSQMIEIMEALRRYKAAHDALDAADVDPATVDCMSTDDEIFLAQELRDAERHLLETYDGVHS